MKRILLRGAFALAALYAVLCASLYWAMSQTPDRFGRVMAHVPFPLMMVLPFESLWNHARSGQNFPGDMPPDFALPMVDHSARVQLSSFRGVRPVVLVFGSYT